MEISHATRDRVLPKFNQDPSLMAVENEYNSLCRLDASNFKSIQAYHEKFEEHLCKLGAWGKPLPEWMHGSIYRKGLSEDQYQSLVPLMQAVKISKRELGLYEMAAIFIGQEMAKQRSEEGKASKKQGRNRRKRGNKDSKNNYTAGYTTF